VMGQIWRIGKRRFKGDWGRRLWMFDKLIWTVLSYGVEIWGWEEREEMEKLEERYIRWVLGVDRMTPWYIIREELQREKLRCRAARRVRGYEKRLEEGRGSELGRECRGEMKKRFKESKTSGEWENSRRRFWEDRGMSLEEAEESGTEEAERFEDLLRKDKEVQRSERWERIREGKYCKWYKEVKGGGIPVYLKMGWGEGR